MRNFFAELGETWEDSLAEARAEAAEQIYASSKFNAARGVNDELIPIGLTAARKFVNYSNPFKRLGDNSMFRDAYNYARDMGSNPISSAAYAAHLKGAQIGNAIVAPAVMGAAGLGVNSLLGNPIGGAIDAVTGNAFNLRPDYPDTNVSTQWANGQQPTSMNAYNNIGGTGDNLYRQQLNDSMWAAEKAARLKQDLGMQALNTSERLKAELAARQAEQAYAQELALQTNKLQADREMQNNSLAAAQANQLLNGYINMIQSAGDRASAAASTRF